MELMIVLGFVIVVGLFVGWIREDIRNRINELPATTDEKPYVTLIRVGSRPGFYLHGKYIDNYESANIDEITSAYQVYDFWHSPEMKIYNRSWWDTYGHPFEDALLDIPTPELLNNYLTSLSSENANTPPTR